MTICDSCMYSGHLRKSCFQNIIYAFTFTERAGKIPEVTQTTHAWHNGLTVYSWSRREPLTQEDMQTPTLAKRKITLIEKRLILRNI